LSFYPVFLIFSHTLSTVGLSAVGIAVAGGAGGANTVVNNMITGVTSPATSPDLVAGIFVVGATGSVTRLHHNAIAMTGDRGAVAAQSPSFGIAITGVDPTVELKNNIFYTTQTSSGGGPDAKSYAIGVNSATFANLDSNYNDFFTNGANAGFFRSGSLSAAAGTDYATLPLWRAATAKDANSLAVDPRFVNPLNDLHLNGATSPLLTAGITGFATVDFDNQPRPAAYPAIGADQLAAVATRILDINDDNAYTPEIDGVLVLRYLFGLRGTALTNGLSLTGLRTNPTQIETYLASIVPYLDVDSNGVVDGVTDGLLILRQLITPAGPLQNQNATGVGATRTTADVRNYILTLRP
jgi:hypothetical protein